MRLVDRHAGPRPRGARSSAARAAAPARPRPRRSATSDRPRRPVRRYPSVPGARRSPRCSIASVLEGVGPAPGIEQVGGDSVSKPRLATRTPSRSSTTRSRLAWAETLRTRLVLEQRPQRRDRLGRRERLRQVDPRSGRAARRPSGRAPTRAPVPSGRARIACVLVTHDAERDPAGRAGLLRRRRRSSARVSARRCSAATGATSGAYSRASTWNSSSLKSACAARRSGPASRSASRSSSTGDVLAQRHELLREQRLGAVRLQALAVGGPLHLVGVVEHGLERTELAHQVARALVADPGDPGHVVDRVAHERQHVHDPLGRDAPLLLDGACGRSSWRRCPRGRG